MSAMQRWVVLAVCVCVVGRAARAEDVPAARAAFLKLIERPRVNPDPEIGETKDIGDDLKQFAFKFTSEEGQRIPGIVIHSAVVGGKVPCVILLHGTGGKKEGMIPHMKKLAAKGCAVAAMDARWHGERAGDAPGTERYNREILKKFKGETKTYPLYWDTVWDAMRLIDILSMREDVDAERIGVMGFSKGGIETYFLAAADPRVAVAVPCIGVQSFKWGLENNAWSARVDTIKVAYELAAKEAGANKKDAAFARSFFDKVAPGIYGEFDGPEVLPLIAPRPLLVINGDSDPHTPVPGLQLCVDKAKAAYEKAGAADKFKFILEPKTGHKVNADAEEEAVKWLGEWLKM